MKVSNRWIASAQDAVHGDRVTTGPFGPHSVHIGSLGSHHRVHIDTRPCAWLSLVYGSLEIGSWRAHCGITRSTTRDPHSFHICGLACSAHRSRLSPQLGSVHTLVAVHFRFGLRLGPHRTHDSAVIGLWLAPHRATARSTPDRRLGERIGPTSRHDSGGLSPRLDGRGDDLVHISLGLGSLAHIGPQLGSHQAQDSATMGCTTRSTSAHDS